MNAIAACIAALLATLLATRRSLGAGLVVLAAVGYAYGIFRANILQPASHFLFDCSLVGLYLSYGSRFFEPFGARGRMLQMWVAVLIGWSLLLCLLPFQPLMVTMVGLRGNIFFLPVLLLGLSLSHRDLLTFSFGLAVLNIVALAFGLAEYFMGIEPFFPQSAVTSIMYASRDAGDAHRIPSLFSSAHAYAGTMVGSLPFLFGAWMQKDVKRQWKWILMAGKIAALCGVVIASTRLFFALALFLTIVAVFSARMDVKKRVLLFVAISLVGVLAFSDARFQRFKTLADSELVTERIAGSVNRTFFEILFEYPMGNGLGGGGTSMPYFLQGQIRRPISMESEFARILAEQGVIGLMIWIGFIVWVVCRRTAFARHEWLLARRLMWCWYGFSFATAAIGVGMLTAIPGTFLFLLAVGWCSVSPLPAETHAPSRMMPLWVLERARAI
jgi:hypothetical protein